MAFNMKNLMFWKRAGKGKSSGETPLHTTMILQGLRNLSGKEAGTVPLIGHLPLELFEPSQFFVQHLTHRLPIRSVTAASISPSPLDRQPAS